MTSVLINLHGWYLPHLANQAAQESYWAGRLPTHAIGIDDTVLLLARCLRPGTLSVLRNEQVIVQPDRRGLAEPQRRAIQNPGKTGKRAGYTWTIAGLRLHARGGRALPAGGPPHPAGGRRAQGKQGRWLFSDGGLFARALERAGPIEGRRAAGRRFGAAGAGQGPPHALWPDHRMPELFLPTGHPHRTVSARSGAGIGPQLFSGAGAFGRTVGGQRRLRVGQR
jgi:hypothetical protein